MQHRRQLTASCDQQERFSNYHSLPHNQRRHYWGIPNKNFGFYTSDQLQELEQKTKRTKTEPYIVQQYEEQSEGKFITTPSHKYVHCCTCHNNPKRYLDQHERCNFCQEYQKSKMGDFVTRNSILSRLTNPEEEQTYQPKRVEDKAIQVVLKLPKICHNRKSVKNCQACKEKQASQQASKIRRAIPRRQTKEKEETLDSLAYSPSARKNLNDFRF